MNPPFSNGLPAGWGFGRSARSVWVGGAPDFELRALAALDGARDAVGDLIGSLRRPRFSLRRQPKARGWAQEPAFVQPVSLPGAPSRAPGTLATRSRVSRDA
eukprot:2404152-Prymnesium_polylepis.1